MLLMPDNLEKITMVAVVFFILFTLAGCEKKTDTLIPAEEKSVSQVEAKTSKETLTHESPKREKMPSVTLTAVRINEDHTNSSTWIEISTSGPFLYNIVDKENPERILIVLHNTTKGMSPAEIAVRNGTINEVRIDELTTGKGSAVKMTIGLDNKTVYGVHPLNGALKINILRIK